MAMLGSESSTFKPRRRISASQATASNSGDLFERN